MQVKGLKFFAVIFLLAVPFNAVAGGPDALIIVPFERDIAALERRWRYVGKPLEFGGRTFQKALVHGREFYITPTCAGLSETTLTCDIGILKLHAKRIISVGLAGALSDEYQVGDVAIVRNLTCHERGSFSEDGSFKPKRSKPAEVRTDEFLQEMGRRFRAEAAARELSVREDTLVSGNSFIAGAGKRRWLRETFDAGLVDMNAGGIVESCFALNEPFCVIRIVSDYATAEAPRDFARFSASPDSNELFWDAFCAAMSGALEEVE